MNRKLDWALILITVIGLVLTLLFFFVFLPSFAGEHVQHLEYFDETLPFFTRLAVAHESGIIVGLLGTTIFAIAVLLRFVVRAYSLGRMLLLISSILPLAFIGAGFYGLQTASTLSAFESTPGLHRCDCGTTWISEPIECRCNDDLALREWFVSARELESTRIGDRLFNSSATTEHHDEEPIGRFVKVTLNIDDQDHIVGQTWTLEGETSGISCRFQIPCSSSSEHCNSPCEWEDSQRP